MFSVFNPLRKRRFSQFNTTTGYTFGQTILCKRSVAICTFCMLLRSEEERQELCCCMGKFGTILYSESSMGSNSSTGWLGREHETNHGGIFHVNKYRMSYYYVITNFKKSMSTIPAAWKVVYILSSFILGSSYLIAAKVKLLDIDFGNAPEGFKYMMYGLSCVACIVWIWRGIISAREGYHKMREQKIKADTMQKKFDEQYPTKKH